MADIDDRWFRSVRDPDGGKPRKAKTDRHGKGKRWLVRWRDESGRQRYKSFETKPEAEAHAAVVKADTLRGTYVDVNAGKIAFRIYADQWRTAQVHRESTQAHIETHLRKHVYPVFGDRQLGSIRPSEIQAWVRGLTTLSSNGKALAPSTARVIYRYVTAIFHSAVSDRLIAVSPCSGVTLPKVTPKRVHPPAGEHVAALINAVPDRYRALLLLAAGTGLRQGEAIGLEVDHVDFLRKTLTVQQQLMLLPGSGPKIAPPKTQASYRTIPLSDSVIDVLAAHLAEWPPVEVTITDVTGTKPTVRTARMLFLTAAGEPIRRTSFSSQVWQPARRKTGTPPAITFHDLRHYYASALIRFGESPKTVQARLGHASASETLDTYSHLWPDSEDRTRQAVEAALQADVCQMRANEQAG